MFRATTTTEVTFRTRIPTHSPSLHPFPFLEHIRRGATDLARLISLLDYYSALSLCFTVVAPLHREKIQRKSRRNSMRRQNRGLCGAELEKGTTYCQVGPRLGNGNTELTSSPHSEKNE